MFLNYFDSHFYFLRVLVLGWVNFTVVLLVRFSSLGNTCLAAVSLGPVVRGVWWPHGEGPVVVFLTQNSLLSQAPRLASSSKPFNLLSLGYLHPGELCVMMECSRSVLSVW